ncbi:MULTISPECIES: vitamin K epoxide reductase family protein [Cyanophyceae]|uniref:Thioredoxin n=1 Tax=Aphanothece cf. minutissima CCALA 015 TaxID=2107695 RepID=A0ABX5F3V9_9CHRO|nr:MULTISPECIES: vitamin K epoxide reductase family protein [Cyanophyceae]MCP9798484.1 vitamin K epoxide reductase family protein [Cyanobium sp. Lug-B]PSB35802.1 thioredoxin [Aphanothece cf. minutissima CCALA 015]
MTSTRLASRLTSRRRPEPGRRWARVVMAVLATIGVIDTASITLNRWGVIGDLSCPGGADGCDKVLNSPWGSVFGQPLSLFGFLAYGAVLVMAVLPLVLKGEARTSLNGLSWWGLFLLSAGMAIFSLVLVGVMAFQIKAFCTFCLMSAAISLTLFVLSLIGGEWEDTGALLFRGVLTVLAVGLIGLGWATSLNRPESATGPGMPIPVTSASTPATVALADHLTATGAVMYSAYWCPHCHDQKQLFGKEAAAKLKIIECAPDGRNSQAALCASKNIQGFPTWEIKGQLDSGQKTLAQLAALSGYKGSIAN